MKAAFRDAHVLRASSSASRSRACETQGEIRTRAPPALRVERCSKSYEHTRTPPASTTDAS